MRLPRWHAVITYVNFVEEHDFEEIEDLHDIVERGADFYTIKSIVVTIRALS